MCTAGTGQRRKGGHLSPEDLIAYADGELAPEEQARVERELERDPEALGVLGEYCRQRVLLAVLCAEMAAEPPVEVRNRMPAVGAEGGSRGEQDVLGLSPKGKRTAAGRRAFWMALAACMVLMLGIGTRMVLRGNTIRATVSVAAGNVVIQRGARTFAASELSSLKVGDVIRTSADGRATLTYDGEATAVELKGNSELRLGSSARGKRLELTQGRLESIAAKQPQGHPMILVTPQAEAKVVGTRFTLDARRSSTWLEVMEGSVELARPLYQSSAMVGKGQFAVAARGVDLVARPVTKEINPAMPLPLKVSLFSDYDPSGAWVVNDQSIQQTKLGNNYRRFALRPVDGAVLVEATVQIDRIATRADEAGFVICPEFEKGRECFESKGDTAGFSEHWLSPMVKSFPVRFDQGLPYHVKIRMTRSGPVIQFEAKLWQGTVEPSEWVAQPGTAIHGDLKDIQLSTLQSACTFTDFKVFLLE